MIQVQVKIEETEENGKPKYSFVIDILKREDNTEFEYTLAKCCENIFLSVFEEVFEGEEITKTRITGGENE